MGKILLMSHCVPPIVRGPSVIINRLFKHFPNDSYVILTSRFDKKIGLEVDEKLRLPCRYYYTNGETIVGGYKNDFFGRLGKWFEVIPIAMKGAKVAGEEKCSKVLVCPTHGNFLLAAWLIHKICRKPLYVYFFDLFSSDNDGRRFESFMRRLVERLVLRSTECAFVMSEKLKDYYQARYLTLNIKIIRHPVDRAEYFPYHDNDNKRFNPKVGPVKIVFAGMIYEYQIDAIQNLARAVNELDGVQFHIYTQRSKKYLEDMGVCGKNIFHSGYLSNDEIARVQKNADILFLPMTFSHEGINCDIVKTASPSKIPEYLAAGIPILIHAPSYSYIAWYANKYEFGLVVDSQDIKVLKSAISELSKNFDLRKQLIANAKNLAKAHDISSIFHEFISGLDMVHQMQNICERYDMRRCYETSKR